MLQKDNAQHLGPPTRKGLPEQCLVEPQLAAEACWTNGALTGVAVCPEEVPTRDWMGLLLWPPGDAPVGWRSVMQDLERLFTRALGDIVKQLESTCYQPKFVDYGGDVTLAVRWAEGFTAAMRLRPGAWVPLLADCVNMRRIWPILLLPADANELRRAFPAETLDTADQLEELRRQLADAVPDAVFCIHRYWQDRASALADARARPGRALRAAGKAS